MRRFAWAFALFLSGCEKYGGAKGQSYDYDFLAVDTYIDSENSSNHSDSEILVVGKSSSSEQRILFKLPASGSDAKIEEAFGETDGIGIDELGEAIVYYFSGNWIIDFLQLAGDIITGSIESSDITSVKFEFKCETAADSAQASNLRLQLIEKGWLTHATWEKAHSITASGAWENEGGDISAADLNVTGVDEGSGVISFDVTNFFRNIVDSDEAIAAYGFAILAPSNTTPIRIYSINNEESKRPVVESVTTYGLMKRSL